MRFVLMVFFVIVCGCSSGPKSPSANLPDPLKLDVVSFKLDNGMQVLVIEDNRLPIFSLQMFYKVGGKDERKGITGASHFLEHLMFKGTKNISSSKFDFIVEGNGGSSNAYTTNDMTVYYENMPSSTLDLMIGVEADRMVNLVIKKKEFEHERQVVLEERKMRYENSPRGQVYMTMMEELFKGTPYGTSVIGDIEDLKTVSRDQIYQYYRQWYAPNNATMVIAGDVSASEVKSLVKKHFDGLPSSPVPEQTRTAMPDSAFKNNLEKPVELDIKGQSPSPMFMLAYPAHKAGAPESYAQDILASILGDGKSSYLNQKFVQTARPKFSLVYTGNYSLEKAGAFMIGGEIVKGFSPNSMKKELLKTVAQSCETAISEESLQKVKNQYESELFSGLDTLGGLARFIGDRQLLYNDWAYYRKEWMIYGALKVDDIKKECKRLFSQKAYVWVTVWENNQAVR
ncbi:MAG: insulinase family protein [Proteobacteria bacterium]|jgi:zinc protease|nr:insulinase family protein [Pseudomonadota bacterium]